MTKLNKLSLALAMATSMMAVSPAQAFTLDNSAGTIKFIFGNYD